MTNREIDQRTLLITKDAEIERLQQHILEGAEIMNKALDSDEKQRQEIERLKRELDELVDEINNYLNNDGSRGHFWVIALDDARKALESILQKRQETHGT